MNGIGSALANGRAGLVAGALLLTLACVAPTVAQAHDGWRDDWRREEWREHRARDWERERWRRINEWRWREYERARYRAWVDGAPVYLYPPPVYAYPAPGLSFDFRFR
jgi:hypothetical protein